MNGNCLVVFKIIYKKPKKIIYLDDLVLSSNYMYIQGNFLFLKLHVLNNLLN